MFAASLFLPALLNAGFAVLFGFSVGRAHALHENHRATSKKLGVEPFDMEPLPSVCHLFCWMCALSAAGLIALVILDLRGAGAGWTGATAHPGW